MTCRLCGDRKSSRGRAFTEHSLEQHILDKHDANKLAALAAIVEEIADDPMPDGAYFAMMQELGV